MNDDLRDQRKRLDLFLLTLGFEPDGVDERGFCRWDLEQVASLEYAFYLSTPVRGGNSIH